MANRDTAVAYRLNLILKPTTPSYVIDIVRYMLTADQHTVKRPQTIPDHPFFQTPQWELLINYQSTATQFDVTPPNGPPTVVYHRSSLCWTERGRWMLDAVGSSYHQEQDLCAFVRWLTPYLDTLIQRSLGRRVALIQSYHRLVAARHRRTVPRCLSFKQSIGGLNFGYEDRTIHLPVRMS